MLQPFTHETPSRPLISICLDWSSRRHFIVLLISVHQKALVGNWCRIYGIIFKLEGVMEFSLCSYLDGRGHFKAHSSHSRRNGTERRDLGLLHVYVHWLTSMYPHNVFMVVEFFGKTQIQRISIDVINALGFEPWTSGMRICGLTPKPSGLDVRGDSNNPRCLASCPQI